MLLACAVLLIGCTDSLAVILQTRGIDAYLAASMKQTGIPNLSVGIVRYCEVVYLRNFGGSSVSKVYPIGSLGKIFTVGTISKIASGEAPFTLSSTRISP